MRSETHLQIFMNIRIIRSKGGGVGVGDKMNSMARQFTPHVALTWSIIHFYSMKYDITMDHS